MRTLPFFVVRNSIHEDVNNYAIHDDVGDLSSTPDCSSNKVSQEQIRASIVSIAEAPDKGFYLDIDNDILVNEFINSEDEVTYLDEKNWQHLASFACLIGRAETLSDVRQGEDSSLKKNVVDIINNVLPLERLFSWNVLLEAREQGDLSWRDIRAFLTAVRQQVVFLDKDGILKAHEPIHLTFHQFVAFARLVTYHLKLLPNVKMRVVSTCASAVDIKLMSSHRCSVQIGLVSADRQIRPTSLDLQHRSSIFASWKSIDAEPRTSQTIKIDSLEPNTSYSIFVRVDRHGVVSSDDDVMKSQLDVVTDCQANIFPTFESLSPQEQKTEIFACINDKTVRKEAPVLPKDLDSIVSVGECSDDWREFIRWWAQNDDIRRAFLMRELMFAASDDDVRRNANLCGISMKKRASKDPKERELWSIQFAAWYYGLDIPSYAQPGETKIFKPAAPFYTSPSIQHYEFTSEGNDGIINRPHSSYRGLGNRVLKAPVSSDNDQQITPYEDEDSSELDSASIIINNAINPTEEEETRLLTMDITSTSIQRQSDALIEKTRVPPLIAQSRYTTAHDTGISKENQTSVVGERKQSVSKPTHKNDDKRDSVVNTAIVEAKIGRSQRLKFLDKVTQKVCDARTRAEQMTGNGSRNLRGIKLLRSKVRLVILLMKLSSTQSRKSVFRRDSAVFDIFDFDENVCNFDALKKNQPPKEKPMRYDPAEANALRLRTEQKFLKKSFDAMMHWTNKQKMMRSNMNAKFMKAREAYTRSLIKRAFRMYQAQVKVLAKERMANDQALNEEVVEPIPENVQSEEEDVVGRKYGIKRTPSLEMRMLSLEDELASKFRENCERFRMDPPSFLPALPSRETRLGKITPEYNDQIRRGIEVDDTQALVYYGDEPIFLYDEKTLKSMKQEKLRAGRESANIFDVPSEVLSYSCLVENCSNSTGFRMREKVKCLAGCGT